MLLACTVRGSVLAVCGTSNRGTLEWLWILSREPGGAVGAQLALTPPCLLSGPQNLAVFTVESKWKPNKPLEAKNCYGTTSIEHPAVQVRHSDRLCVVPACMPCDRALLLRWAASRRLPWPLQEGFPTATWRPRPTRLPCLPCSEDHCGVRQACQLFCSTHWLNTAARALAAISPCPRR